jgi:hypothetical protein
VIPDLKRLPGSFSGEAILTLHVFISISVHPLAGVLAVEPPAIFTVQGGAEYLSPVGRAVGPKIYVVMDVLHDVVGIVDVYDIILPVLDAVVSR